MKRDLLHWFLKRLFLFVLCMKNYNYHLLIIIIIAIFSGSCKKIRKLNQDPEIEPLKQGFKVSAAIGYCASLANTLFNGEDLPGNVLFQSRNNDNYSGSGIMFVDINKYYPLPFNNNVGQIIILCLWNTGIDGTSHNGVITAIFTDIDILESQYEFRGIHTVPVIDNNGKLLTLFAKQDVIIGEGSDTLLNLSLSNPQFDEELGRLDSEKPGDVFAAVHQDVWFVSIDQNNTLSDIYDDDFTVNGGGQIAEVTSTSGGILYHAMINAVFNPNTCEFNPMDGVGFIQNIKAGSNVDLGNIFLSFHNRCDGKAYVEFAAGKYLTSNHQNVNLSFY